MPAPFRWLSVLDPVRHFLHVVRAIFLKGEGIAGLWPQYVGLLAMAICALAFSVLRFRKTVV
jgi:ABC-2 type transport system permease protein